MIRSFVWGLAGMALLALGILIGLHYQSPGAPPVKPPETTGLRPQYRSGPFRIGIEGIPATPRVGANRLWIVLKDEAGDPVGGAALEAVAEMPAMGAMPAMQAPAEMREIRSGLYEGTFDLSMEGSWPLTLRIKKSGLGGTRLTLDMATGRRGLQLSSGATPLQPETATAPEPAPPGTVTLDPSRRQLIGVKIGEARVTDMRRVIRAVGRVTYDETLLADVTLKFDAWIGELYVDYVGATVKKGRPLFTVYGPELLAAQQEYLELKRRARRSDAAGALLAAARKRLSLWDMQAREIAALERRGVPYDYVPIHAPRSGTVVTRHIVEGTAQKAGTTLMRIADLSRVWVEANVYESELPLVQPGMSATVRLPYLPGQSFEGAVDYVYPYLEGQSRTGRIRIVLANPDGVLKPDMYAEVKLEADLGKRLTVPEEAVIIAGDTRVVFEDLGGGRLSPRRVETGQRAGGRIEILSGLDPGDRVVTSGNFLIASESRLKAGIEQW
ncbi:efflux RND transporter periplasmic adaptor subunit [Methylohalobius crimeensis]|uniref:efflux RND transporter periplasmic adaptor subunit n=1 Tax=Methylohalobius crimeensis TaxID=244365 RepID=UPI0003B596C0|nr:efflux RND transporter periplasmic adaptor subunit [Methylohalobius crimeensis]